MLNANCFGIRFFFLIFFAHQSWPPLRPNSRRNSVDLVGDQATCDALKKASPADLHDGQRWLKIAATDILGTTQGRLLRELPAPRAPVKRTFEFQIADDMGLIAQLSFVDRGLSETVTGGHARRWYFKCF